MIIVQNNQATTEFQSEQKVIKSTYRGRFRKDLAVEHIEKVIAFYSQNEVRGSIIDISKGYGSFAKLFEYLTKFYYPVAFKSGLSTQAYVVSSDLLSSALGKKLGLLAKNFKVKAKVFIDKKDAESWINKKLN